MLQALALGAGCYLGFILIRRGKREAAGGFTRERFLMAAGAPQVFKGVTPEQYARLVEKARTAGIELNGNSGIASRFGVEIAWNYLPEAQELTLQCVNTPFFMSAADVDARIQKLVRESMS